MKQVIRIAGYFCILATLIPFIPSDMWYIRMFDFPHAQLTTLTLITFVAFLFYFPFKQKDYIMPSLVLSALIYQSIVMYPYTPLSPVQVLPAAAGDDSASVSILSSNVYMKNRNSQDLVKLIREKDADIVLLLEPDERWKKEMEVIHDQYPYRMDAALSNTYGMLLYSKLKLIDAEIKYLVKADIPSIDTRVKLRSGKHIQLYAVHPEPPSPTETEKSTARDGELMIIGNKAARDTLPVIVVGDLNDVAWSKTTKLFQKVSHLLDPRIGRGFYNTFNAKYPIFRWPLDHLFHSDHFELNRLERLPDIGSDHFPIFGILQYSEKAKQKQAEPVASPAEQKQAQQEINKVK